MMKSRSALVGYLILAMMVLVLGAAPALASREPRSGPNFESSAEIAYAQAILQKEGYLRPETYTRGMQDDRTLQATRQFQRDHFLRPSGQLDPDTMGVLTTHGPVNQAALAPAPSTRSASTRTMPVTDSPLATQIAAGLLLMAGGAALLVRRVF